jgi:EPS-associated MarR family transcriptional regulator
MNTHYGLLKILSEESHVPQRALAQKLGVSLGKVNFCLGELAEKGWIKVQRFKNAQNKAAYAYLLTPWGMEEKARLTLHFLKQKMEEYERLESEIAALSQELEKESPPALRAAVSD